MSTLTFAVLIAGATSPAILGATVVQKISFTIAGTFVLSVAGSFTREAGWMSEHRGLTVLLVIGGVVLVLLHVRSFWQRLKGLRVQAKIRGAILARPRDYLIRVAAPSLVA